MERDAALPYTSTTLQAADGFALAAREFAPSAERRTERGGERGVVVIAPAMGVVQDYYVHFATWLGSQGFRVLTFDYRGMGASRRGPLRGFDATVLDWARLDGGAMLDAAVARAAGDPDRGLAARPVVWLGHSLGGQILAFVPGHERVVLLAGRLLREAVLQQSALSPNDAHCSAAKTAALVEAVLAVVDRCDALVEQGVTAAEIEELDWSPLVRTAAECGPDDVETVRERRDAMLETLGGLT